MKIRRFAAVFLAMVMLLAIPSAAVAESPIYGKDYIVDYIKDYGEMIGYAPALRVADGFEISAYWGLEGSAEQKAIMTSNQFEGYLYEYLTYDATVTFSVEDDENSDADRFVNLVYHNGNLWYSEVRKEMVNMSFAYDFGAGCFRFTDGFSNTADEGQILPPVYREIADGASEYHTLGMTVEKDRIRCFYNGELIFDYKDTEGKYLIALEVEAPIVFWQEGNHIHVTHLVVDRPGYLLTPSYNIGDTNNDGRLTLGDVSLIMKQIAKWSNLNINLGAADFNRDGKITLNDASLIMYKTMQWYTPK